MALYDGPHLVTVFPEEVFTDSYGSERRRPAAVGVQVRCRMAPISAGARDRETPRYPGGVEAYHFSARTAPLGSWSRVEWGDKSLTIASGPYFHGASDTTARVTADLVVER